MDSNENRKRQEGEERIREEWMGGRTPVSTRGQRDGKKRKTEEKKKRSKGGGEEGNKARGGEGEKRKIRKKGSDKG